MIWIRIVFLVVPALLLWIAVESARSVRREVRSRPGNSIVLGVTEEPGRFNPFEPGNELTERMEGFLFDRLLMHGDDSEVVAGLAESWSVSSSVRFIFASERQAQDALEDITAVQAKWEEWGLVGSEAVGDEVRVVFKNPENNGAAAVHALFDPEATLPIKLLRVRVLQSAWDSYLDFKKHAIEAGQVRREWPTGISTYELAVAGNTDGFFREFKSYYDSNENLGASYRYERELPYLETPELLFKLRENIFWHDGTPFTGADVAFSIELSRAQPWNPRLREILESIQSVAPVDAQTVRILYWKMPPFYLEKWVRIPMLPKHLLEGMDEKEMSEEFGGRPVGTGPLRVLERYGDGGLVLGRHERYHLGAPETGEFVFAVAPDRARRRLRFLAGEIDSYVLQRGEEQFAARDSRFLFLPATEGRQVVLVWNGQRAPFDRKALRGVLGNEIQVEKLIENISPGQGVATDGLFRRGSPYAREGGSGVEERIEGETERLLKALGWKRSDGKLLNGSKEEFTIRLASGGDEISSAVMDGVAAAWEGLGAKVLTMELPAGVVDDPERLFSEVNADAFVVSLPSMSDWLSFWDGRGGRIVSAAVARYAYGGERAAELIAALGSASDEGKRVGLYREFERILIEEEALRCLFAKRDFRVVRKERFAVSRAIGDGHRVSAELEAGSGSGSDLPWWVRRSGQIPEPIRSNE